MQLGVAVDAVADESPMKPRLDRVLQVMSRGIKEGRSAIQGLRSSDSETRDLVIALSGIERELSYRPDIDFRVNVVGTAATSEHAHPAGDIVDRKRGLLNAFCHSGAKRIEFELEYADRELQMRVRDDGIGISWQVVRDGRKGHWGLAGMEERAARIGGLLKISSSPSNGTEVGLSIPRGIAFQLSTTESRT